MSAAARSLCQDNTRVGGGPGAVGPVCAAGGAESFSARPHLHGVNRV